LSSNAAWQRASLITIRLTRSFSAAQTGPSAQSIRARCNRAKSEEFPRKIRAILGLFSCSGVVLPAMTHLQTGQIFFVDRKVVVALAARRSRHEILWIGLVQENFRRDMVDGFAWPTAMYAESFVSIVAVAPQLLHLVIPSSGDLIRNLPQRGSTHELVTH